MAAMRTYGSIIEAPPSQSDSLSEELYCYKSYRLQSKNFHANREARHTKLQSPSSKSLRKSTNGSRSGNGMTREYRQISATTVTLELWTLEQKVIHRLVAIQNTEHRPSGQKRPTGHVRGQ